MFRDLCMMFIGVHLIGVILSEDYRRSTIGCFYDLLEIAALAYLLATWGK